MGKKAKQSRTRALTIYLARSGVKESSLIANGKNLVKTAITSASKKIGNLYSKPSASHEPSWVSFFDGSPDVKKLGLRSAGASAVLVVPLSGRLAAVCFGYGRHLLNAEAVEPTFGLKVTLNCVDESGVRSIDRKTFEGITTHVREQASKQSSLASFGLDVERDLLRAVVGRPTDAAHGVRLTGRDALSATVAVALKELPSLLAGYVARAADNAYKAKYPWIDNICEVQDKSDVDALDQEVVDRIIARDFAHMWLAVPDMIDWANVGGFRYGASKASKLLDDIHLESYVKQVRKLNELTLERLKTHRVSAYSATTDAVLERWPLYRCIYAEVDRSDGTYLLNNGSWFLIDRGFVDRVDGIVDAIPETKLGIIPAQPKEAEDAYNIRLSKALGNACVMDKRDVMFGGGKSRIEFCDVFTAGKQMIHVKRYSGSAVLSHLFAQGVVAASAFLRDAEFRKQLNTKLPKAFRLNNPLHKPRARGHELAFVILSKSQKKLRLPFFSRVTLRNAFDLASSQGYRVTVTKVASQ